MKTGPAPFSGWMGTKKSFRGQAIVPTIETLHVELLSRFDTVHPPELCRQDDLALGGDGRLHAGKIPSYLSWCQALHPGNHGKYQ